MDTREVARKIVYDERQFDLTIIDADHSRSGVRDDLANALAFSRVILLHDTYHPPVRKGILDVVRDIPNLFYDLELVPGGLQDDGLWGGLGIVILGETRSQRFIAERKSMFGLQVFDYYLHNILNGLIHQPKRMTAGIHRFLIHARG